MIRAGFGLGRHQMRRFGTAVAALAVLTAAAGAAGYDEFALGVTANVRDDHDGAVKHFTAALAAGDLVPANKAAAYRGRAAAYLDKDLCREALADLEALAALQPLSREEYYLRAGIKICLKDNAGAEQDFEAGNGGYVSGERYDTFGRLQWQHGDFANARVNLGKAAAQMVADKDRDVRSRYIVLWYAISADRVGSLDRAELKTYADFLNSGRCPMPILDFYLGKRTMAEVQAKAADAGRDEIAGQKCEADFYIAEWHIARGDTAAAKPLIAAAVAGCPKGFIELFAAQAEAERLGLKGETK